MLKFNKLYVNDGKLYIGVEVLSDEVYRNVYLSTIKIDTQDTFGTDDGMLITVSEQQLTEYDESFVIASQIKPNDPIRGISDTALFFVTVTTTGAPASTVNCGEDITTITGVCMDLQPFYTTAMSYIKGICKDNCNNICDKSYFVDYILKFKAMELAAKTSNYTTLIKLYNDFFRNITPSVAKGGCGCGH